MRESEYQGKLIKKLYRMFPECFILKNDSGYLQGVPDLLLLIGPYWFMLEVKASANSPQQPNQEYYVERLNEMSFAAFIYPSNEAEVLRAIQQSLQIGGPARLPAP